MDSRATDHITFNLTQLVNPSPYQDPDQLQVGNGDNLTISHTS